MAKQYVKVRGVGGGHAAVLRAYANQLESNGYGRIRKKNGRSKA